VNLFLVQNAVVHYTCSQQAWLIAHKNCTRLGCQEYCRLFWLVCNNI